MTTAGLSYTECVYLPTSTSSLGDDQPERARVGGANERLGKVEEHCVRMAGHARLTGPADTAPRLLVPVPATSHDPRSLHLRQYERSILDLARIGSLAFPVSPLESALEELEARLAGTFCVRVGVNRVGQRGSQWTSGREERANE